jgi:peptidyl-tRNA hydrolase, PTH1 family
MCVNYFARKHDIRFDKKRGNARIGEGEIDGIAVIVARPQTFMNNSGKSVNALIRKLKINSDDIIVIHDDLDLPLGRIRIRVGGSSGGHKGIESIIGETGTAEFVRIKIGIGRPDEKNSGDEGKQNIISYVLGGFSANEHLIIKMVVTKVSEAIECLTISGLVPAMDRFNSFRLTQ